MNITAALAITSEMPSGLSRGSGSHPNSVAVDWNTMKTVRRKQVTPTNRRAFLSRPTFSLPFHS